MKKLISIVFFLLVTNFVMSQSANVSYPTDKTFMYGGEMTKDLFDILSNDEQDVYLQCVKLCGLNPDSVIWISGNVAQQIANNLDFCSERIAWVSTQDKIGETEIVKVGSGSLKNPECIVFIKRQNGITKFTFQMYY